jgi:hypothetical protein
MFIAAGVLICVLEGARLVKYNFLARRKPDDRFSTAENM